MKGKKLQNIFLFCPSKQINPLSAASLHVLHFFRGKPRNGRFCGSSISTTFSLNANREISGKAKSGVMSVKISRVVRTLLKISKQVHRIYCVGRNYWDHGVRLKPLHLFKKIFTFVFWFYLFHSQIEMGGNPEREPPFFFMKPADSAFSATEFGENKHTWKKWVPKVLIIKPLQTQRSLIQHPAPTSTMSASWSSPSGRGAPTSLWRTH